MNVTFKLCLRFAKQYWAYLLFMFALNTGLILFAQENLVISGDQFTVTLFATTWWFQNAILILLLAMPNGHASLWQQIWPSASARNVNLFLPTLFVSVVSQWLPVLGWLAVQQSTLGLDWVALSMAWILGILGSLSALFWLKDRSWQNVSGAATCLLAIFWAYLPTTQQFVWPLITLTGLGILVFRDSRRQVLGQFIVQAMALISLVLLGTQAFHAGLSHNRHESSSFASQPTIDTTPEYQANQNNEQNWLSDINQAFRAIPDIKDANETESLEQLYTLYSPSLQSVQSLEQPPALVFNSNNRLYVDWLSTNLKAPSIDMSQTPAYQIFTQQVRILWQTSDSAPPIIQQFAGGELALLNQSVLWFGENQSNLVWRDDATALSWFAIDNRYRREFIAFGNDTTAFVASFKNEQLALMQFDIDKQPLRVGFSTQTSGVHYADFAHAKNQYRLSWQASNPNRIIKTETSFIPSSSKSSQQCNISVVLPIWIQLRCVTQKTAIWVLAATLLAVLLNSVLLGKLPKRYWLGHSLMAVTFSWPWLGVMWFQRKRFRKPPSAPS